MSEENNNEEIQDTNSGEDRQTEIVENNETNSGEGQKLEALEQTIKKLEERLDHQSRILGKQENEQKRQTKSEEEPKAPEKPKNGTEKFTALEAKIEALEAKNNAKLEAVKRSELASSLVANGVDPTVSNDLADFLAYKQGDNIKATEDDLGNVAVTIGEEGTGVNDWAKAYLNSDGGKVFSGTVKGPSTKNHGKPPAQTSTVSMNPLAFSRKMAEIQADQSLTPDQKSERSKAFNME